MNWLSIGLIATALGSLIGTIDKVIVGRYLNNSWAYPFFISCFLGFYCAVILGIRSVMGHFQLPSPAITFIALLPGFLHYLAATCITRALMTSDASVVFGISQTGPIFSLFWGFLVFSDFFLPVNYLGILLIVFCAVVLGLERGEGVAGKVHLNRGMWLVIAAAFLRSLSQLCIKVALEELPFWDAFALSGLTLLIPATIVFSRPVPRRLILGAVQQYGVRLVGAVAVVEAGGVVALLLFVLAFSLGPLALVSATQSTAPMFILLYTLLFNRLHPGLVPVGSNSGSNRLKFMLCLGIALGVYLLNVGRG